MAGLSFYAFKFCVIDLLWIGVAWTRLKAFWEALFNLWYTLILINKGKVKEEAKTWNKSMRDSGSDANGCFLVKMHVLTVGSSCCVTWE